MGKAVNAVCRGCFFAECCARGHLERYRPRFERHHLNRPDAHVGDCSGARRLIVSPDGNLLSDKNILKLQSARPTAILSIYPPMARLVDDAGNPPTPEHNGAFARYTVSTAAKQIVVDVQPVRSAGPAREIKNGSKNKPLSPKDADFESAVVWQIKVPRNALEGVHEVLLNIDYVGDTARAYVGEQFVDD
jgi:beta-galactosidase